MAAIRDTFFQECEEQLAALESGLLAIEGGDCDPETVNAVFRAVHSVKGGAGAFGLDSLVRFAHVFETALDEVRAGRLAPSLTVLKVMLRAADALTDLVHAARSGTIVEAERNCALAAELSALSSARVVVHPGAESPDDAAQDDGMDGFAFQPLRMELDLLPEPADRTWSVRFSPQAELYAKANESAVLLRELGRLGTVVVELDVGALPAFPDLDPEGAYLVWKVLLTTSQPEVVIREVFEFVEGDCKLEVNLVDFSAAPAPATRQADVDIAALIQKAQEAVACTHSEVAAAISDQVASQMDVSPSAARPLESSVASPPPPPAKVTIRVDLDRVDRLIDLVGELVINRAMLAQRVLEAGFTRSSDVALGLGDLEQLTREMQDSVMAIRAQPVKSVFQRMPRLVREVATLTGKPVRLVTEGEGTEVDKTVIEHLADPLTHMIRNAIDHGLEIPEDRQAAGKPPEGTVRLAARHRSGRIVIEVADDGAGIDRPRVRASAIAKGLIEPNAILSDDEIDNLIFMPGFSTAETVSNISGRGVGMDVVKRSIQALGGRITIASRPGHGSVFTMSLPLTLAVLDGMVVSVAGQTLVAPFTTIIETMQPRANEVHRLINGALVIAIRGSYIPLVDVGVVLGYRADPLDPATGVALLIEGESGARAALLVDAIQGQQQVVIKSLEPNCQRVPGIAAATILGDGRVALIFDVDDIVDFSSAEPTRSEAPAALSAAHA